MSVFVKIKHLFRHSVVYSVATILQKASAFLLLPFLTDTELLPTEEYSGYLYFMLTAGVLSQIFSLGMESTIVRFIKMKPENKKHIVNSAISLVLVGIGFGFIIALSLKEPIAEYLLKEEKLSSYVIFLIIVSAFDLLSNLPNYYYRADERPKTFTFYKVLRFLVEFIGIYIGLAYLKMGFEGAIYGLLAASVTSFLIMLPFYFKYFRIHFEKELLKEMLFFGLPLVPNAILYLLIEGADRYFIEGAVSKDVQTIYTNMYKFGGVLTVINMAFRSAWQPIMLREVQENNNKEFFAKVMTYFTALSSIIMVFISLLAIDFIQFNPIGSVRLIIKDQTYYQGKFILGFILLGYVMLGIYYNLSLAFYVTKRSKNMMIYTGFGLGVNALINCVMFIYPFYAMQIASIATFLAFFVMAALAYIKSKVLFPVKYDFRAFSLMFIYTFAVAIIVGFFSDIDFVIKTVIAFGYIAFLFVTKVLTRNDVIKIKSLFGR